MREARIILPQGHEAALGYLETGLADTFGGFIRTIGQGAWRSPRGDIVAEPVDVFDVAMVPGEFNEAGLRNIARHVATLADQECVYVRHASGDVEFVEPEATQAVA